MELPAGMLLNGFDAFILIFVRMTGIFVIAPIFGRRNIPAYFKIGLSLMMALILINTVSIPKLDYFDNIFALAFLVFKEFIVGLTLGYVSYLVFASIYMAGQIIDMQVGFGMVNVLDPVSNIQVPITSNFYFIMSMLVFLAFNGHHALIKALFESYSHIPLGQAVFDNNLMDDIVRAFGNIFLLGFKISAPIVAAILITDVTLGVISRSVPQLNFFVVGMPVKILIGLLVMVLTVPIFISMVDILINGMNNEMLRFMRDMGSGGGK
ncbi:MAG: flagellar biosynthetic protein FliR [Clostridia bacterium]|nr:flagellar biosynthetic protein FliR [Clostridia bacterium]